MKLDKRYFKVQEARNKIAKSVNEIIDEYELTNGETVSIIAEILSSTAKYMIRDERHPEDTL